jgi:hypothetical protein
MTAKAISDASAALRSSSGSLAKIRKNTKKTQSFARSAAISDQSPPARSSNVIDFQP